MNGRHARQLHSARIGFTLVELLVTLAVIAILSAIVLGALSSAAETTRERRTQSLIRRLDAVITARWDSYRTRRVTIGTPSGTGPAAAAWDRLWSLRELMRFEMPQIWSDVDVPGPPQHLSTFPALQRAYKRKLDAATNALTARGLTAAQSTTLLLRFQDAECLYLIVSMANDEGNATADHFRENDVGDADGDTLLEFHDGWGQPIRFLRWAPGYVSELQPAILPGPDATYGTADDIKETSAATKPPYERDQENYHDPFDPMRVDMPTGSPRRVFKLYPLIYSAGPDGQWDLGITPPPTPGEQSDPYQIPSSGVLSGGASDEDSADSKGSWAMLSPLPPGDGVFGNSDNITNHQMGSWVR